MITNDAFEHVEVSSNAALNQWLSMHHNQAAAVWLVTYKKHTGASYVSTSDILDQLIAFGWIDGIRRKLDDDRVMQLIAPRKMQIWAKTYQDRANRLIAAGRMQPSGQAAIDRAHIAGLWNALADVDALHIPDDLVAALAKQSDATQNFAAFAPSYRRNVLRWIAVAKTPETRARRIDKVAELAARKAKVPQF